MGGINSRPILLIWQAPSEGGENDRIKYAAASCEGLGQPIKHAHAVVPDLGDNTSFFGVYSGHGGTEVALLCAKLFHTELRNHPDYQNNFMRAMKHTFFRMDEVLLQSDEWKELIKPPAPFDWIQYLKTVVCANYWPSTQTQVQTTPYVAPRRTGSTACIVVIRGNQIMVGNVGDSRCVLSSNGQGIQLTTDHKPNEVIEKQRILRAGGQVFRFVIPTIRKGQWEVFRINGVLAVSRVIGYFAFKRNNSLPLEEQVATCNPDLISMDIDDEMEFLVIASNSIWEYMSTNDVVTFVRNYLRAGEDQRTICEMLVRRAALPDDNATAILVQFKSSADRLLRPLTDSDGGVHQEGATTGGNRTEHILSPTPVEDEEDDDDYPAPPALEGKKKEQQDGESGGSETHPLLGSTETTEE